MRVPSERILTAIPCKTSRFGGPSERPKISSLYAAHPRASNAPAIVASAKIDGLREMANATKHCYNTFAAEVLNLLILISQRGLAEREGFEPSVPRKRDNGFRDRPVRPLRHLSV